MNFLKLFWLIKCIRKYCGTVKDTAFSWRKNKKQNTFAIVKKSSDISSWVECLFSKIPLFYHEWKTQTFVLVSPADTFHTLFTTLVILSLARKDWHVDKYHISEIYHPESSKTNQMLLQTFLAIWQASCKTLLRNQLYIPV